MKLALWLALFSLSVPAHAQLDQILKKADETLNRGGSSSGTAGATAASGLTNDKIVAGLKQALQVSTGNAVAATGKPDGFLKNSAIKILLPPRLQTVGNGLRMVGMGAQVDELEV